MTHASQIECYERATVKRRSVATRAKHSVVKDYRVRSDHGNQVGVSVSGGLSDGHDTGGGKYWVLDG